MNQFSHATDVGTIKHITTCMCTKTINVKSDLRMLMCTSCTKHVSSALAKFDTPGFRSNYDSMITYSTINVKSREGKIINNYLTIDDVNLRCLIFTCYLAIRQGNHPIIYASTTYGYKVIPLGLSNNTPYLVTNRIYYDESHYGDTISDSEAGLIKTAIRAINDMPTPVLKTELTYSLTTSADTSHTPGHISLIDQTSNDQYSLSLAASDTLKTSKQNDTDDEPSVSDIDFDAIDFYSDPDTKDTIVLDNIVTYKVDDDIEKLHTINEIVMPRSEHHNWDEPDSDASVEGTLFY